MVWTNVQKVVRSVRQQRFDLVAALREDGRTWVEISYALQERWSELTPRRALRLAHTKNGRCWTQKDAAEAWGDLLPDERTPEAKEISRWETWPRQGGQRPSFETLDKLAQVYECRVADLIADIGDYSGRDKVNTLSTPATVAASEREGRDRFESESDHDPIPAIELLTSVEATDIGPATTSAVEATVNELSHNYPRVAPAKMLLTLQGWQRQIAQLLNRRTTLAQRRELMNHAGWLSLLTATADIDVARGRSAAANFEAAKSLAGETGDTDLSAWVLETRAWQAVSGGQLNAASDLCRAGLDTAPAGSEVWIHLCTQAARVSARRGDGKETHRRVDQAIAAVGRRPAPESDHHFAVGEERVLQHCAAALVWLGGGAIAEDFARRAVAQHEGVRGDPRIAHPLAVTRLNLAILLARNGEATEAAHLGSLALDSAWRLCSTDLFLLADLDSALATRSGGSAEAASFHDRYIDVVRSIQLDAAEAAAAA